ncbi:glycosyltransferase [Solibacillus silvestris]|uniref:glycosyltransferase n=1 Tax=Solibacillus silvestris TaxID=76853 RepID=UPI003F7E6820
MMKVLIVCDHFPVSPRVLKMKDSILKQAPHAEVKIFSWNRGNAENNNKNITTVNREISYGNRLNKALYLIEFYWEFSKFAKMYKPHFIHAIDLEMFLVSTFIKFKGKLIYEVYDIKFFRNKYFNFFREKIEFLFLAIKKPAIILASPFFEEYYKKSSFFSHLNKIVINNKPSKKNINFMDKHFLNEDLFKNLSGSKVIGFIGTVRYIDLLINLIEAIKDNKQIKVLIAGEGPDLYALKKYVENNGLDGRVLFTGRYDINEIEDIYYLCDYIWAAYPSKDINVKYAISNKFFESMAFKKKVIVSENTKLGDYVFQNDLGIVVNPYDVTDIIHKIESNNNLNIDINVKKIYGDALYWEDEEHFLKTVYTENLTI